MNRTLEKAIDAYGGRELWSAATSIEAEFSAWGLAFIFKQRPRFQRAKIKMEIARPVSRITPIGSNPDITGGLHGPDVHMENSSGELICQRKDARSYFPGGRRFFYWDDLDMAYFANYAMWNYLALPALLLRTDIFWTEIEPGLLEAIFPESIPTHNQSQRFRFDRKTGRLLRHDYTAEVISSLAKAAHVVLEHSERDGISFTSHRRVTPLSPKGKPLRGPTLIEIVIHDYRLNNS